MVKSVEYISRSHRIKFISSNFWAEYKTIFSIRNKGVHAGARVQESQAQMVVRIAASVIKHLQAIEARAFGLTAK